MSEQVLHLDFVSLSAETAPEQRSRLLEAAAGLTDLEQVIGAGVIEGEDGSDFDLAFWFLLPQFTALEPFGTHPAYARFLQGNVAPVLRGFAGADVWLLADFEAMDGEAACLALSAPEETYDFEIRETLESWCAGAERGALGLAVGDRPMYRGAAVAFGAATPPVRPEAEALQAVLIRGKARSLP